MIKYRISVIILIVFVIYSCNSETPTVSETGYGNVIIQANADSAEILIDGEITSLFTPDTLELLAVKHNIKVRKAGYFSKEKEISVIKNEIISEFFELSLNTIVKNIVIETFGIINCDTCSTENEIIESAIEQYGDKIIVLNYPKLVSDPSNPLTLTNFNDLNARQLFYSLVNDEQIFINGNNNENINLTLTEEAEKKSVFEITVNDSITQGDVLIVSIFLDVYDIDSIPLTDLILQAHIIEDNIEYPDSNNELIKMNDVFREFITSIDEISLSSIEKTGRRTYNLQAILDPRWNKDNLRVVSFVQNQQSRKILQTAISN